MEYIVPGICGLLLILGLVAIVMSRSNWRIPQIVLSAFILIFSLAFFYLAARTLKTHENWEREIKQFQDGIARAQNGDPTKGELGILQLTNDRNQLKQQVAEAMAERGRMWPDALKDKVNPADGTLVASFEQPPPGLEPKAIVFVFEQNDKEKGGQYLGEFSVVKVEGKQVTAAPASTLVQRELNLIAASKGPWVFYEIMPIDSHSLFAETDPSALKGLLPDRDVPAAERDEYARDGKPAKEGDPTDRVSVLVKFTKAWPENAAAPAAPADNAAGNAAAAPKAAVAEPSFRPGDVAYFDPDAAKDLVENKKVAEYDTSDPAKARIYVRPLRDYARLFRETYRRRNELFALLAETKGQADRVATAVGQVQDDIKAAEADKEGLSKDLAKFKSELDAVVAYQQSLEAKLAKTRATLSELFRSNLQLSAQLADAEKKAAEAIHRQAPPAEASASLGR
ncbi:MAG TPA: hypothetical protein VGY55_02730 [Pirellulales bacterium]|jgi:hypothetical protein|nr:hypothetical protein [Pirellulales bacterium]